MEVEVHEAVGQQASTAGQGCGANQGRGKKPCGAKFSEPLTIQHDHEPRRHGEAGQSSLQQEFEIVIMGVIDKETIVEDAMARKRGGEGR